MRSFYRILLACVLSLSAAPLHAQWVKTDGPDSVQVLLHADPHRVYAGTKHGVFSSSDTGTTWVEISTGLSNRNIQALAIAAGRLFAGTAGGGIFRSPDNGANWESANHGLTDLDVRSVAFSFPLRTLLAGTPAGVFRSSDSGATWTAFNSGLPTLDVRDVIFNWNRAYAGTDSGVFYLPPGDSVWVPINNGLTNLDVRTISPTLCAGTDSGVFLWREHGSNPSWIQVSSVPGTEILSLSASAGIPDATGDAILAGTNDGVFWGYPPSLLEWVAVNEGLTDLDVRATALPENTGPYGYMFVGTETGVWRRPMSEVMPTSIRPMPRSSALSQLRLVGSQTVAFSLPARTPVSLTLHDLSGRTRATLLTGELAAGSHTARIDAMSLPAGLYVVRLRTPGFTETRRVLLTE